MPMDENKILEELIVLLEKLSIPVKQDRGDFKGGLIRYHDETCFYINRKAEATAKINLILEELKRMDIPKALLSDELFTFLKENDIFSKKESVNVN